MMKHSRLVQVSAVTASLVFASAAFAKDSEENEMCPYTDVRTHTVQISVGKDKGVAPVVEPETLDACYQDTIDFIEPNGNQIFVRFRDYSPFLKNLNGPKGKAKGRVNVDPKGNKAVSFKYAVHVVGYPVKDPYIRIRPR